MTELIFLGTGGGRFTTISQARQTGGMYLVDRGFRANIDPGPGALVHMHRYGLDPTRTNTLLVTHAHPDHWTDTTILLEGMTRGGLDKHGTLVAPPSVLNGVPIPKGETLGPVVSKMHQKQLKHCYEAHPGNKFQLDGGVRLETTKQDHSDPDTIGFKLQTSHGQFSYIPDTQYFDALASLHKGSRMVVCQMTRGGGDRIPWHMCTEDVIQVANELQPKMLLLTHFGYKLLKEGGPGRHAARIMEETGVPTFAARDGMHVIMEKEFELDFLDQAALAKN